MCSVRLDRGLLEGEGEGKRRGLDRSSADEGIGRVDFVSTSTSSRVIRAPSHSNIFLLNLLFCVLSALHNNRYRQLQSLLLRRHRRPPSSSSKVPLSPQLRASQAFLPLVQTLHHSPSSLSASRRRFIQHRSFPLFLLPSSTLSPLLLHLFQRVSFHRRKSSRRSSHQ